MLHSFEGLNENNDPVDFYELFCFPFLLIQSRLTRLIYIFAFFLFIRL